MTDATVAAQMPSFMTAPGETDVLFVLVGISLLVAVFLLGVFYFKLHALPERMAHANNRIQYQVVAVLALLGLLTHNNLFWVAALLLATIQLPDLMGKLSSMAQSLERMAAATGAAPTAGDEPPSDTPPRPAPATASAAETDPAPDVAPGRGTSAGKEG